MADLPPRLSEQQQYILATLTEQEPRPPKGPISGDDGEVHKRTLSQRVAREMDPDGDGGRWRGYSNTKLSDSHSASFSRALSRLVDRGLVEHHSSIPGRRDSRHYVTVTADGREAGEEILRRHRDGRHSLRFETVGDE